MNNGTGWIVKAKDTQHVVRTTLLHAEKNAPLK